MKKIMFSDKFLLTKAVLEGRKTQTRRIVPSKFFASQWDVSDDTLVIEDDDAGFVNIRDTKYCRYKKGEIVAVAQSYCDCGNLPDYELDEDDYPIMPTKSGFFNKMFVRADLMPNQIRITDVRVEKLQDISDECCLKEGVIKGRCGSADTHFMDAYYIPNDIQPYCTPREAFAHLINEVSKKDVWSENPYVFVYDFELVK